MKFICLMLTLRPDLRIDCAISTKFHVSEMRLYGPENPDDQRYGAAGAAFYEKKKILLHGLRLEIPRAGSPEKRA